eukprot:4402741-Karenia_brevis.AAC.1
MGSGISGRRGTGIGGWEPTTPLRKGKDLPTDFCDSPGSEEYDACGIDSGRNPTTAPSVTENLFPTGSM